MDDLNQLVWTRQPNGRAKLELISNPDGEHPLSFDRDGRRAVSLFSQSFLDVVSELIKWGWELERFETTGHTFHSEVRTEALNAIILDDFRLGGVKAVLGTLHVDLPTTVLSKAVMTGPLGGSLSISRLGVVEGVVTEVVRAAIHAALPGGHRFDRSMRPSLWSRLTIR